MLKSYQNKVTLAVTVICGIFFYWIFYPGVIDPDSHAMLMQITTGKQLTNIQPIFYKIIWKFLLNFYHGTAPLLFFNNLIFWTGVYLFISSLNIKLFGKLFLLVLIALNPIHLSWTGTVTKDYSVVCFIYLYFGFMLQFIKNKNYFFFWSAVVVLLVISLIRHNGIVIVFPLSIWQSLIFFSNRPIKNKLLKLLTPFSFVSLIVALNLLSLMIISIIYKFPKAHIEQQIFLHDLATLSIKTDKMLIPEPTNRKNTTQEITLEQLKKIYRPRSVAGLYWNRKSDFNFIWHNGKNNEYISKLRTQWFNQVLLHPKLYFEQRTSMFIRLLNIDKSRNGIGYGNLKKKKFKKYSAKFKFAKKPIKKYLKFAVDHYVYKAWVYYLGCIIFVFGSVVFIIKTKTLPLKPHFWLFLSGFLYTSSYYITAPTSSFRMVVPMVASFYLALILFILRNKTPAWKSSSYS